VTGAVQVQAGAVQQKDGCVDVDGWADLNLDDMRLFFKYAGTQYVWSTWPVYRSTTTQVQSI